MNRVAVLLGCILTTASPAQSPRRDVTFTMKMTTDSGGQSKSILERFLASGLKTRMEISTIPETRAMGGTFNIMNGADSTVVSVMPSLQMAMIIKMPTMKGDLQSMMPSVSGATRRDSVDLGPSEAILGYPTRHYRVHTTATFTRTFPDRVCTQMHSGTSETWVTADTEPGSIIQSVTRSFTSGLGGMGLNGQSLKEMVDSVAKERTKSMALRTINRDSVTGPDGQVTVKTTTVEYTELSMTPVDSTVFAIPSGFQVNDMRGMTLPDMSSGMAAVAASIGAKASGCVPKTAP